MHDRIRGLTREQQLAQTEDMIRSITNGRKISISGKDIEKIHEMRSKANRDYLQDHDVAQQGRECVLGEVIRMLMATPKYFNVEGTDKQLELPLKIIAKHALYYQEVCCRADVASLPLDGVGSAKNINGKKLAYEEVFKLLGLAELIQEEQI